MKMKKNKRNMLLVIILLLIVMIIIIGVVLVSINKKNKLPIINDTDPNGDMVTVIDESNINSQQIIDLDDKDDNNGEKKYQELNNMTYYSGNSDNKTFRIQDVIHNQDGTITIKGRVYEYIELPDKLSVKEYQALLDGKTLNILGEKVTKIQDDNRAKEAGYEIALKVESKKYDYEMLYYVDKNEDGTANLYNGSDSSIARGTDVYLEKTLNGDFECSLNDEKIALKDYFKKDVHIADKNKTRLLHENDEFVIDDEDNYFIRLVLCGF